ncbi:MAG: hypothetical protein A3C36_07755 [Omnitrophica WOR_2 bacterium RIFCSPHIGHO2_02_FULL_52_10]|nr:MAG: hypothetical protein A3C36_07755 [Omnitrophica WOR_2 bacterium RIFCSPHIGHO2_02_FULL_52_10]
MKILQAPITTSELKKTAAALFGDMAKAVVDVDRRLIALDAELHSDLEALLLENGSSQNSLWGINLYPGRGADEFVEFDSMINIRPSQRNMGRGVDDQATRQKIMNIVHQWMK